MVYRLFLADWHLPAVCRSSGMDFFRPFQSFLWINSRQINFSIKIPFDNQRKNYIIGVKVHAFVELEFSPLITLNHSILKV